MPISKKLRLVYVAEWLLALPVSAIPVEHSPVVAEGDSGIVVMLGKREENSESLKTVINEAAARDHDILAHSGNGGGEADSDGDSVGSGDSSDRSSVPGGPQGGIQNGNTTSSPQLPGQTGRLEGNQGPSTAAKNLMIAGGAIAAFILVAAIAFWLYKAKGKIFQRVNFKYWKRGGAQRLPGEDMVYDEKSLVYPQSTISRPGMERKYSITGMPFPPPPAALASSGTSLERLPSRKRLLIRTSLPPKNRPVSSPAPMDEGGTFYEGASDADSPSSEQQEQPPLPPPAYMADRPLLSPSQSSSISNIKPRNPAANSSQPPYAQIYPPPPIPESNTTPRGVPPMESRFSWTTTTISEAPSGAKSVRSSVDSEPRFRGVNSWVSHQAGRLERGERLAQLQLEQQRQVRDTPPGSSPGTPRAHTHHPGAHVSFLADRVQKESADLDKRSLQEGR